MCGINGIFSKSNISKIRERLDAMNKAIAHRGPDGEAVHLIDENIGLAHRRLAIIDLDERAAQPMISNSGNTIITYNGEVFNFVELKNELKGDYHFKTESDTEVLLAGYELKGLDWLLSRINGMFAFAIYDKQKKSMALVRDRFGIKPLCYSKSRDFLIFSSEIKAILASGLINPIFNEKAIDDYLGHRYVREPYTFFENIFQIPSAHYMLIDESGESTLHQYWQLPELNFEQTYNEQKIIDRTEEEIVAAIHRWEIADVRVGTFLSGGVDSSLTSAVLAQSGKRQLDTYTIGFPEEGFNEFEYARMVVERYHTNHREFLLEQKDYFSEWERLIEFKDAPLAVPNEIPLAIMSSYLSKDITVVISGEGADELFGGYGRIFRSAFDYENTKEKNTDFYNYFTGMYEYTSRLIRDKFINTQTNYRQEFDNKVLQGFSGKRSEENIFRYFHQYHIKGLLQRVDMTAMQASVEARPPFLDHELIEYVYTQVPYDLKLKWKSNEDMQSAMTSNANKYSETLDTPKYILKKIAEKYLPLDVIYRKKMGFPVPLNNWFPELEKLSGDLLHEASWLNQNAVHELTDDLKNGSVRSGQLLWMFLNIELFRKKYFYKNWIW